MKAGPYSIEISEEAEFDFDKSYDYYYEISPNLADAFFKSIDTCFKIIQESPLSYQVIHKGIRRFTLKRFPFVIYYLVDNYIIKIIAIFHTSRNPKVWTERTEN